MLLKRTREKSQASIEKHRPCKQLAQRFSRTFHLPTRFCLATLQLTLQSRWRPHLRRKLSHWHLLKHKINGTCGLRWDRPSNSNNHRYGNLRLSLEPGIG